MGENIEVLVCREALERGLISRQQHDQALKDSPTPSALLVARGALNAQQLRTLKDDVSRRLAASALTLPTPTWAEAAEGLPDEVRDAVQAGARKIGKYQIVRELGRGGMGAVHKAWDVTLHRWVALKLLLNVDGHEEIARFRREAQSAATLSHPGIVAIYDIGQDGESAFIAMEYVRGSTLRAPQPVPRACEIMISVARAVDHAHRRGIVHRDLKPANIMIDDAGQLRVMDFGLAKPLRGRSSVTLTGTIVGTPSYMPPEQADGHVSQVDHRSDVYSLGAVLYELLTGRPPFEGRSVLETLTLVVEKDPVRPSKLNRQVPRDLETIVLKALDKDKTRRFPSAEALARDLERFLKGQAIEAKRRSIASQVSRSLRRRLFLWIGGAAAVAAAVLVLVLAGRSEPPDLAPLLAGGDRKLAAGDLEGALTDFRAAETLVPGSSGPRLRIALDRKAAADAQAAQTRKAAEEKIGARDRARREAQPEFDRGQTLYDQARLDLYRSGADLSKMRETLEEAARHLTRALDALPEYPEALLLRARARSLQGRPDDAVRDLDRAIELLPAYPAALLARGQILLSRFMEYVLPAGWRRDDAPAPVRRWIEQAVADLKAARDHGLQAGDVEYCDASLALAEEKPQLAVTILTRAIDGGDKKEELHRLRGDAHSNLMMRAGGTETRLDHANAALRDYTEAIRMRPNDHEAYRHRAALFFTVGKSDECLADLQSGLRMNPSDSVSHSDLGTYYQRTQRPDAALDCYARALSIDPENFRALSNRAAILTERRNYAAAREDLNRALKVNPDYVHGRVNLAALEDLTGRPEEAVKILTELLRRQPMLARAWYMRGIYRNKLQSWAEALDDLEKAAGIDPAGYDAASRALREELKKRLAGGR